MPAKPDRMQRIIEKARRAVEQSQRATVAISAQAAATGGDGGGGSVGGQSILDEQGRGRWIWGVSEWGGEDVFVDG